MPDSERFDAVFLADRIRPSAVEPPVEAIGVRNGVIAAMGSRADAARWVSAHPVHDFGPATVTAGLIDAHSHAVSAGVSRRGVDLSSCTTLDEVVRLVLAQPDEPDTDWRLGWSLDPNLFDGGSPSNKFLSGHSDRPVFVKMADGHSAVANDAALQRCGITGRETFTSNASVAVDGGAPTGLLLEGDALQLVNRHIPPLDAGAQAESLRALLQGMAATGLTTLSLLDLNEASLDILRALEKDGELPLRLRCSPVFDSAAPFSDEVDRVLKLQGTRGRRWQVEGVKLVLDGTIDNGTAWLQFPDTFGDSTQSLWRDPTLYRAAIGELAARGVATATHAIGDAAIREAVTAIAGLAPELRALAPHRIEHVETVPADLLPAFAASGAIASMQPTHSTLYVWPDHEDEWSRRLGETRAQVDGFRFRDLSDLGITVVLGSDWPVAPYDPRGVIADAQLRRPHDKPDAGTTFPRQALTPAQALDGYTRNAARAIGWSDCVGALHVGKKADLTVFEFDPLTTPADRFAEGAIIATTIDGDIRWT